MKRTINILIIAIFLILFCLDYFNLFSGQNEFGLCILLLGFLQLALLLFMLFRNNTGAKSKSRFIVKKGLKSSGNFYDLFLAILLIYFSYWGIKELFEIESISSFINQKPNTSLAPNTYLTVGLGVLNFAGSLINRLKTHFSFEFKDKKLEVIEEKGNVLFQLYNDTAEKMSFQNGEIKFNNHKNEQFHVMKDIWMNERKFRELQGWLRNIKH